MTGSFYLNIKRLTFSFIVFSGLSFALFSQTPINGIINDYGSVTSLGIDFVIVPDAIQFARFEAGDTVLLIQMKGARIYSIEASSYGTLENYYGKPGKHEFLLIDHVESGANKIVFRNNIVNAFDINSALQIVKVPSFNSAVVTGSDLTCAPWDSTSKTGGVLTMIIGRTLILAKNIDVKGKGFMGGAISVGTGLCAGSDAASLDKYVYNSVYANSGFKGESPVTHGYLDLGDYPPIFPDYMKGKGANFTGGGGGNGKFSGGGGGANYGLGGKGGREQAGCSPFPFDGGNGAKFIKATPLEGGIFMGGGGGSSTYLSGSSASPGGNGGGVVIIVCDTIIGNGNSIIADGAIPGPQASSDAGAGGGGGGGSVAIYLQSFSTSSATSQLTISARGGKGGSNAGTFGEGGGGGGGFINISNISVIPSNVTRTVAEGGVGTRPGGTSGGDGTVGESLTSFVAVLNGFLFNSIISSVTGDQSDSICSNMMPPKISGTKPVGGTPPYTYIWEKSYDEAFTSPVTLVNDSDPTNYTPAVVETDKVWFRRTITDSSLPLALVDVSKPVKMIVQPFIKNNIVGTSDTICFAQNPPAFDSKAELQDGNGIYAYKWEVSTDNSIFNLPANTYNTKGYTPPPALGLTSWYRRTVTSGRCIDSTTIVKITVLDTIKNNRILNSPPDICFGTAFNDLSATSVPALAGGDNSYLFRWESSINGTTWGTAPGVNNGVNYNPGELSERIPFNEYLFRRVVYSGMNDVCVDVSNTVLLKDFPVITNNSVTSNQTVCSGSPPAKLTGSTPLRGNNIYTYAWQDSSKARPLWSDITGATGSDFQPPALTDTTRYRRIVYSSACSDISKSIMINVHKPVLNNSISLISGGSDTTICNGAVPYLLKGIVATGGTGIPGNYAYLWLSSADNSVFSPVPSAGTGVNYQPPALTATTYYKRQVISGTCTVISNTTVAVTVLPLITGNTISENQTICSGSASLLLTGTTPSGGAGAGSYSFLWEQSSDGTSWSPASGTNNQTSGSYQPPALTIDMKYKRIAKSGVNDCCINISNIIEIKIHTLVSSQINAGPDTTLYSFDNIINMVADPYYSYETGLWTLVSGTGDFDDDSDSNTKVRNLSKGKNTFLWTVTNGPCILEDKVNIDVYELVIPEGFSPNNDPGNFNNTFIISGLDLPNQIAELKIVNGAGTEVFSTTNSDGKEWIDWDGKNSKGYDLPEGTYYYLIKLTSIGNGQVFKKSGFIVLKRY